MSHLEYQHYPLERSNLPPHWRVTSLGEVALDVQPGFASGKHNKEGAGIPHIRPMNIDRLGRIDLSDVKYVAPETHTHRLGKGDVLFNNTNSPELIGKTAAITLEENWGFSNHMTRLRLPEGVDHRFVAHQLHFLWMTGYFLHRCVHHVNQASLSSTALAETVPLLLASFNEQCSIVAKIEELFSDLDAGVATLERLRANLKRYRAAVLKAAIDGKLTEDWRAQHPDTEPASVLLKRLQGEQQGFLLPVSNGEMRNSRRSSRLAGSHSFDQHHQIETELPSGWALARLDQICKEIVDCPHSTPKWTDKGIACVRTTEFRPGRLLLDQVRYVSESTYQARIARLKPQPEDILYSREGGILGIACIVPPGIRLCLGQRMMLMRATVSSRYLMHVLNSPQLLSLVAKLTGGSASPHLNVGDVKAFPIPFPPYAEQLAIVQEIESRLSIVDEVEAQVEANLKRAARLRQGILKRAFEGRLVPQDPTDEPGSRLLKRVREGLESYAQGDIGTASKRPRQTRRGPQTRPIHAMDNPDGERREA